MNYYETAIEDLHHKSYLKLLSKTLCVHLCKSFIVGAFMPFLIYCMTKKIRNVGTLISTAVEIKN